MPETCPEFAKRKAEVSGGHTTEQVCAHLAGSEVPREDQAGHDELFSLRPHKTTPEGSDEAEKVHQIDSSERHMMKTSPLNP